MISPEQTAYVRGRFIGENIRMMEDIIEYTHRLKITGLIVFLDFGKAFDSIEWNFMTKTLQKFGFGETFLKCIDVIYNSCLSCVKVNGYLT